MYKKKKYNKTIEQKNLTKSKIKQFLNEFGNKILRITINSK